MFQFFHFVFNIIAFLIYYVDWLIDVQRHANAEVLICVNLQMKETGSGDYKDDQWETMHLVRPILYKKSKTLQLH